MMGLLAARKKKSRAARLKQCRVPGGCVVWAIGDIHGRYDLLHPLLAAIVQDLTAGPHARRVVVTLGDYVDRGPQSREVLDELAALAERPDIETHFMRGNHDDRMEAVLGDPSLAPLWCEYGGRDTMRSYGVTAPPQRSDDSAWKEAVATLNASLPRTHREFLYNLQACIGIGDYFFCHAGARPGVPLEGQSAHDLMWIRTEFLGDAEPFERLIVHGHSLTEDVHSDDRRIGLDTGAYATGVLSALRLEGAERRLLQTSVKDGAVSLRASAA